MKLAAGIKNLRLKFPGKDKLQFKDLSISIYPNENVLLLGPSGCGKSTLLQVLTGLIPNSMEIPLKADEIVVADSWGYVFQDPDTQFCMPYVDEELAFVLENRQIPRHEMNERMANALAQVGLHLPKLHMPIASLSQGMKQRLAIACALLLEPEVMFLDEPTALLDPQGTEQVWQSMRKVAEGRTLIIVEHKLDHVLDIVDRIILFNHNGEIVADGPCEDILHTQRKHLQEYGIWYPGVWEDYRKKQDVRQTIEPEPPSNPTIILRDFHGLRGKSSKIRVDQADVYAGDWITVIGENGTGKSTLLLALMKLIRTQGLYELYGKPAGEYREMGRELAYVFQNPEHQFVTNSVYDEIAYTLRLDGIDEQEIESLVIAQLAAYRLSEQREQHPYQLSMGQKRRLSVAAAITRRQPILLLDEPTFGQDASNTFALMEQLELWRSLGSTIMMVTHDMNIVRYFATRVWVIENGVLVRDITSEQLFQIDVREENVVCN